MSYTPTAARAAQTEALGMLPDGLKGMPEALGAVLPAVTCKPALMRISLD